MFGFRSRGVRAAAGAAVVAFVSSASAQHGVGVQAECLGPRPVGSTTQCTFVITHNDTFGDTLAILEAFDVVDPLGTATRVPAVGNLEIIEVDGNTDAVPGPFVGGILIGPPGSTSAGLPGEADPGRVTFVQNSYVIQPGDPNPLDHQVNVMLQDLCDGPGTIGCSGIPVLVQFSATTEVIPGPPPPPRRPGAAEKGSLLHFSKIDLRWDDAGSLLQDTFVSLTNDYPEDVRVQMYFVNGDPPLAADPMTGERAHPGWNAVDNLVVLTADQPTYWSALTGQPGPAGGGVSPFTVLDPGFPPGRPAPNGGRMLRGFIFGWAVDEATEEIRWNHLAGEATLVNYARGTAWTYGAWATAVVAPVPHGARTGTPGTLLLDGVEYTPSFDLLLMNFQAVGSSAFSGPRQVISDTDITFHPVSADVRQEGDGPITTKASFDVWNMNEVKFSGQHRCVTCWDETLASAYDVPNHLLLQHLQTEHGKARIDGKRSQLCDVDVDPNDGACGAHPEDVCSEASALFGLVTRVLTFDGGADHGAAGTSMIGMGLDLTSLIRYDLLPPPPEASGPPAPIEVKPWMPHHLGGDIGREAHRRR